MAQLLARRTINREVESSNQASDSDKSHWVAKGRGPLLANSTISTEKRHPPALSLPTLLDEYGSHFFSTFVSNHFSGRSTNSHTSKSFIDFISSSTAFSHKSALFEDNASFIFFGSEVSNAEVNRACIVGLL